MPLPFHAQQAAGAFMAQRLLGCIYMQCHLLHGHRLPCLLTIHQEKPHDIYPLDSPFLP